MNIESVNKGTGAGGKNTNRFGKEFETLTCNQKRLLEMGYVKFSFTKNPTKVYDFYLSKTFEDKTIIFVLQQGLKDYMKIKYNIHMIRQPDEAYIVEYKDGRKVIKILEKKEQRVEGSVDVKLWAPGYLKREYEIVCNGFEIQYALTVSDFLKNKFTTVEKFRILSRILQEDNVPLFFGSDKNYFEILDEWINH
jgi:hypothetical protein